MPAAFHLATAVELAGAEPVDGGSGPLRWRAELPTSWDVPSGVHGGILLATALRAAEATLDEAGGDLDPVLGLRTAHASFLARPDDHRLVLDGHVARRGGTTAHVDVATRSAGDDQPTALLTRALFARTRDGDAWLDATPPDVPAPDACPEVEADAQARGDWPMSPPPLFAHLDLRTAFGVLPWDEGWAPGAPARYARWNRYHEAPARHDGTLDPLALLPLLDLPGPAVWLRFGPGEDLRLLVSLELRADLLEPVTDEWVLTDFRVRWAGDGYLVADGDAWSAGRLVATVRQTMLVRRVAAAEAP